MENKKTEGMICNIDIPKREINQFYFDSSDKKLEKKNLLLHSCCGPCSTAVIERLIPDYNITIFYYNPCITEDKEYERRKETQKQFINKFNKDNKGLDHVQFVEGKYDPKRYLALTRGLEEEPEGGARCSVCFEMRLRETAEYASKHGFHIFGTTLTVSPHKNYNLITEIGQKLAKEYGLEYLDKDFKKKAGFQRSVQLSKEYGLYRQNYCGCDFSKMD